MIDIKARPIVWLPGLGRKAVTVDGQGYSVQGPQLDRSYKTSVNYDMQRFEIQLGDHWQGDVDADGGTTTRERSEWAQIVNAPLQTPMWMAWDFYLEPGAPSTANFCVIGQWHGTADSGDMAGSPPWAIEYTAGGALILSLRTTPLLVSPGNPPPVIYQLVPQVERNRWYRLVAMVCMDWTVGGTGAAKLWIDGTLLVDVQQPIGYNDAVGPFFKAGIYRSAAPETLAVVYANMRIGTANLAGRVSRPLPLPVAYA